MEIKKYRWYWLSVLGLLLTKEEYALLLIALGLTIILHHKQLRLGILTFLVGVLSFFLIIYFVIPFFQKGSYTHFEYGALGNNPVEVLINITLRPLTLFTLLISPPIKLHTLFETFFSFGFLPLLVLSSLIPVLQ